MRSGSTHHLILSGRNDSVHGGNENAKKFVADSPEKKEAHHRPLMAVVGFCDSGR
jgi:hypothetical protein